MLGGCVDGGLLGDGLGEHRGGGWGDGGGELGVHVGGDGGDEWRGFYHWRRVNGAMAETIGNSHRAGLDLSGFSSEAQPQSNKNSHNSESDGDDQHSCTHSAIVCFVPIVVVAGSA